MNKEDIIRMAREAGFTVSRQEWLFTEMLERFFQLAYNAGAAAERKRITDLIRSDRYGIGNMCSHWTNEDVAEDIEGGHDEPR